MTVPDKYKQSALMIVTGLVISFVRHTMDPRRIGSTWIDFFGSWLLHTVGLLVLIGFAGTAIEVFHKFYLGVQFEDDPKISPGPRRSLGASRNIKLLKALQYQTELAELHGLTPEAICHRVPSGARSILASFFEKLATVISS